MAIQLISQDEFENNISRMQMFTREVEWLKSDECLLFGAVVKDTIDNDWGYIVLSPNKDGEPETMKVDVSLESREQAYTLAHEAMLKLEELGTIKSKIFEEKEVNLQLPNFEIITVEDLIQDYFKKYPEEIYKLSPRKFEELVAGIIKDLGYEVELTQATRDGGRDIIARIKTGLNTFLTHIECKKYNPDNKVGVKIVREVIGAHNLGNADRSLIITSSFFTKDAITAAEKVESFLAIKDFNNLKEMLLNYKNN